MYNVEFTKFGLLEFSHIVVLDSDLICLFFIFLGVLAKLVEIKSISSHSMELGLTVVKTMKSKSLKIKLPTKKSLISVTVTCPACFGNFNKGSKYLFSGKSVNIVDKKTVKSPHFAQPYDKKVFKALKKTIKRCNRSSRKARRHAKKRRGRKNNHA